MEEVVTKKMEHCKKLALQFSEGAEHMDENMAGLMKRAGKVLEGMIAAAEELLEYSQFAADCSDVEARIAYEVSVDVMVDKIMDACLEGDG